MSHERKLYGRKKTRALGHERQEALTTLLPRLQIAAEGPIDPAALFPRAPAETWLEIGFGNGEHVAALMRRHPDRAYLAAEPFITGMAAFLKMIEAEPHENIRVWMDDAVLLIDRLPDACLDGVYILNPDPWPKRKHARRRVVSAENLDRLARVLKPGGQLIMATDAPALADWMVTQAVRHAAFAWTAGHADDWRLPPFDWDRYAL